MASVPSDSLNENEEAKRKTVLEEKSKEDLIKIVRKQLILLQKAKGKADELNQKYVALDGEKRLDYEKQSTTILNLQQQIENLEINVSDLKEEKNKLEERKNHEIQQLEEKLKKFENENIKNRASLNENEEKLQCLTMQLNTMKETCLCFQDEITKLQKSKLEMETEMSVLIEARDSALESLKSESHKLISKNEEHADLKKKYAICIEENCSLTSSIENLISERKSLQIENSSLLSKIETCNSNKVESPNSNNSMEIDNDFMLIIADNQKLQCELDKLKEENNLLKENGGSVIKKDKKSSKITISDKSSEIEDIWAIKRENQELLQNLCNIESSHSKLKLVKEELENEKDVLLKSLSQIEEEKLKATSELDSALKEKMKLKEELDRLASLQSFGDFSSGYEYALLHGASTENLPSEDHANQNASVESEASETADTMKKSDQCLEMGFFEQASGFEFGLLGGGDVSDLYKSNRKEDSNYELSLLSTTGIASGDDRSEVENIKSKETELESLLENLQKEKDALTKEIIKKEATCQEYASLIEEIVADNESLKLKIENYEKEKFMLTDIKSLTPEVSVSCDETTVQMVEEHYEKRLVGTEIKHRTLLSSLEKENRELNNKIICLDNEKAENSKKWLSLCEELESLKLLTENYKVEIKNMEVLKDNIQEHSNVLEKQNYELSEKLTSRCSELDDINFQIELLVISIKQGVRQKTFASPNKALKPLHENICLLKTLVDDLVILSNTNAIKLKSAETDLKELLVQKQACDDELFQMKELNQFLEDEAKELRNEVEQLKISQKSSDIYHSLKSPELYSIEEIDEKSIPVDANDETDTFEAESSNIEEGNSKEVKSIEATFTNDGIAIEENLDSLNTVLENKTISNDIDYKSAIEQLTAENTHLKTSLDVKSKLVDGIHCQMDNLLEKVEGANLELKNKDSDLKNSQASVEKLQNRIEELQFFLSNKGHLGYLKDELNELKTVKINLKQYVLDHNKFFKDMHCTISDSLVETENKIKNEYEHFNIKYKHLEEIINFANLHIDIIFKNVKLWESVLDKIENKKGTVEDSEDLINCTAIFNDLSFDLSPTTLTLRKSECGNNCCNIEDKIHHLFMLSEQFSSKMQHYLNCTLNISVLHELNSYKTDIVPNLEATIKGLKDKLQDYSSRKCEENSELISKLSVEKYQEKVSEGDSKDILAETEVKMNKFKQIAVKLKKELVEYKKKVNEILNEKEKLQLKNNELQQELEKYSSEQLINVQNYQSLQNEYDKIQDELDVQKENGRKLEGDLSATLLELNLYREQVSSMESQLLKANQMIEVISLARQEKENAFIDLESKLIVVDSKMQGKLEKIEAMETTLKQNMEDMSILSTENNKLKEQLNKLLKDGEKSNLLDLEIADYEKSIQDLNIKVQKKEEEIDELKEKLSSELEKKENLLEEIKFTETTKATEEKRANDLKESLEKTKSELLAVKEREAETLSNVASLQMQLEILTQQEENCKLQLSETTSEVLQLKEMLKTSSENQQRIVRSLESKISCQKQEIVSSHKEVESIKQEFENYKTRVHSVLKQQKSSTPTVVSVDDDLKEKLESVIDKLKLQIKDLSEKLKAVSMEYEALQDEHDILLQRHSKAIEDMEKKDAEWLSRLEQINFEKSKLRTAQEEQSSQHLLQNEMLVATYKKQIKIMSDEHKRTANELQKQLEAADMEIARLQRDQQKVQGLPPTPTFQDSAMSFDILSQERQEGEGSESIDDLDTPIRNLSLTTIPTSGFLPFEKLLLSTSDSGTSSTTRYQDCEKMLSDLNAANKQIEHLSGVLNDSETTNLRLSEQVRVLKEEVRRLERNKEREEHAENLEYLKNVIIKFATLSAGSEKAMLIPVLTTMLKLSPAEQQQLKSIAGDHDPNEAAGSGWGSYIHRWSGLA